jgi:hypothetical protein
MKKFLVMVVSALFGLALFSGTAIAKDDSLEKDFALLEKSYIPPLFYTSNMKMTASIKSMEDYRKAWNAFKGEYYFYRADQANWQGYFDEIEWAIQRAEAVVAAAQAKKAPEMLPQAHEELEHVRAVMLDLRGKNGFSKFITDKLTIYHDPMEKIVLTLKDIDPSTIDDAMMEELALTLKEGWKAFEDAEKCPVDQALWNFTDAQIAAYYNGMATERAALERFEAALLARDKNAMKAAAAVPVMKVPFVTAYSGFGDMQKYATLK